MINEDHAQHGGWRPGSEMAKQQRGRGGRTPANIQPTGGGAFKEQGTRTTNLPDHIEAIKTRGIKTHSPGKRPTGEKTQEAGRKAKEKTGTGRSSVYKKGTMGIGRPWEEAAHLGRDCAQEVLAGRTAASNLRWGPGERVPEEKRRGGNYPSEKKEESRANVGACRA